VRRITALTGIGALQYVREMEHEVRRAAELLKTTPKELSRRVESTQKRVKELERKVEEVTVRAMKGGAPASGNGAPGEAQTQDIGGIKVLTRQVDEADPKILRTLADQYRDQLRSGVVALGGATPDGKALILVAATKDVVEKGFKAGDLIREMAKEVGGAGGGKPDMAQAGGSDPSKIPAAFERLYGLIRR
jgi:alanyl-tRNA synthetase